MRVGKPGRYLAAAGTLALAAALSGGAVLAPTATATPSQDCRTYSSTTACGEITLNPAQKSCVTRSVGLGMTERRAEVECSRLP